MLNSTAMGTSARATNTAPSATTSNTIAQEQRRLERRMEDRWRALALAEQRGQSLRILERMYTTYTDAVDDYILYVRQTSQPHRWPNVA